MTQIFISHSARDSATAQRLKETITSLGHGVTTTEALEHGEHVVEKLLSIIRLTDVVLGLLDENSTNVPLELGFALGLGKRVVVVTSRGSSIPTILRNVPYLHLEELDKRAGFEILAAITDLSESQADKSSSLVDHHSGAHSDTSFERTILECFSQTGAEVSAASMLSVAGYDFVINYPTSGKRYVLAFKRYSRGGLVSIEVVRELLAAVEETGAHGGIIVSSSDFTKSARDFAKRAKIRLFFWQTAEIEAQRPTHGAEWSIFWQKLIDQNFERDTMLALGNAWLRDRENQPAWPFVWQTLIDQNFERASLLPLGREWLRGREDQPEWNYIWQKLIDQNFERDDLLTVGNAWLRGRENQPTWPFVWQKLIDQNFEREEVLAFGREWLRGREDQPSWPFVWQRLIDQNFECDNLLPLGRDWLRGRENQVAWNYVWQKLIDQNFERETLLPLGRDWLRGRENEREWVFVWRKLMHENFERGALLALAQHWLRGREGQREGQLVANFVRAADEIR